MQAEPLNVAARDAILAANFQPAAIICGMHDRHHVTSITLSITVKPPTRRSEHVSPRQALSLESALAHSTAGKHSAND